MGFENGDIPIRFGDEKPVYFSDIAKTLILSDSPDVEVLRNGNDVTFTMPEGWRDRVLDENKRGLFTPIDLDNLHVAVDNHLMRVAIRTGILHLEDYEIPWFKRPVNYEEDIIARMYARKAYKLVAKISNINPMLLDDLIWSLGRSCCLYGEPICDSGQVPLLNSRGCPFRSICKAYSNRRLRMLNELEYLHTWYY